MITVIIKRSYLFPIPNIVKHHKTIITMFEIRKEIVNSVYKENNRKRGLRDKSLELKTVDIRDFMWADKHGVDENGYVLMVVEDCY